MMDIKTFPDGRYISRELDRLLAGKAMSGSERKPLCEADVQLF